MSANNDDKISAALTTAEVKKRELEGLATGLEKRLQLVTPRPFGGDGGITPGRVTRYTLQLWERAAELEEKVTDLEERLARRKHIADSLEGCFQGIIDCLNAK